MKKHLLLSGLASLLLAVAGCANQEPDASTVLVNYTHLATSISESQAKDIAAIATKSDTDKTRSGNLEATCTPILSKRNQTRSDYVLPDTLAFVINYPDNGGFAIVSAHDHVYPLLAFADEGNFSYDNEIATSNFVELIEDYITFSPKSHRYEFTEDGMEDCYITVPNDDLVLDQRNPFDKYVIQEHPGCPVGCVAVATAYCMIYKNHYIEYHGDKIWLISIINAYKKHKDPNFTPVWTFHGQPTYSYESAQDYIARILYWIGQDVNMDYKPNGSGAISYDAYCLLRDLGYTIPSGWSTFNADEISSYLIKNHMIYMRGRDYAKNAGHAWIMNGYRYCVDPNNDEIQDFYYYCNWGWGGSCNGFFSGKVFSASSYNFSPQNYFAVEMSPEVSGPVGPIINPPIRPGYPTGL